MAASWFRLVILCVCVAAILAAVNDGPADEPTTPPPEPACNNGDRQADTTDCHKYTECKKGVWKADSCFWIRKFDSVTLKCMWWGATCAK